ncbi:DUF1659 domain-containing protein [Lactobacillus sp. ESL0791]|uniref:DUF1659 domain-containing protein n=1 Tax=Lactobacillus sp. ESL0791 TaxID=2983234 RepID=UPI0023F695B5|nr:DUF1659 domain-containing protein [Lactobacillus sp. ESL0791]MDF7639189.1 DUF1659 domain-containing protein [Lactobacillus sp. ESL0791]
MNFELIAQSIQYTFSNAKYKDGKKSRIFKNVREQSSADSLAKVGKAIAGLQDDALSEATLIQKQGIQLSEQE